MSCVSRDWTLRKSSGRVRRISIVNSFRLPVSSVHLAFSDAECFPFTADAILLSGLMFSQLGRCARIRVDCGGRSSAW